MAAHGLATETKGTASRGSSAIPTPPPKKARLSPRPSRSQDRKRRADEPPQDQIPPKKPKSSGAPHRPSNFPPEFYDNLSTVWLTRRALQELDRRNESLPPSKPTTVPVVRPRGAKLAALKRLGVSELALSAAAGGPDLRDLRGYPEPAGIVHVMASASSPSSSNRVSAGTSAPTQPTSATNVSSKTKRSSAYDTNFGQHCIDHRIFPPWYRFSDGRRPPKPANLEEIRQALRVPRGSLSPSLISEAAFEDFQVKNVTKSEGALMRKVIPILEGDLDIPNEGQLPFLNLESITGNTTIRPIPDYFDGARLEAVDKQVREDLNKIIIPTKHASVPVAPNFFLEAKGPTGTGEVARGQAILDGAHGALMMHALQNYHVEEPVYDGKAYAFTSTLLDGQLRLFAHHLAAPAPPEQKPDYYTTQLKGYALTGDSDTWREGTGAFRNLRVLARDYRDRFIEDANARARQQDADVAALEGHALAAQGEHQDAGEGSESSSPASFFDCQPFTEAQENGQDASSSPQDTNLGLAIFEQSGAMLRTARGMGTQRGPHLIQRCR